MTTSVFRALISMALLLGPVATGKAVAADIVPPPALPAAPQPALAPVSPAYNWSGFHIGGSAGWASRVYDWRYTNPNPATITPFPVSSNSGIFGGFAGAQYQFGQVVFGVEYNYNDHFGRQNLDNVTCGGNLIILTCRLSTNALHTVGGKLGWAFNDLLLYASGGYAWTRVSTRVSNTGNGVVFDTSNAVTQGGAYAGAGLDYAVWKGGVADLIAGVEYQHIWIGSVFHGSSADNFAANGVNGRAIKANEDLVRFKLSLKFNPFR
jgi:outer membrane immunogenic protein